MSVPTRATAASEPALPRTAGCGLALVGYRATGKSTVGRIIAARLGRPFIDADALLEARLGQPIREFFTARGEPAFRDAEAALLEEICRREECVVATGGGVILRPENRDLLRTFGTVVWLKAAPDVLCERLRCDAANDRPALTAAGLLDEVAHVLAQRTPLYDEVADLVIDTTGKTVEQVAGELLAAYANAPAGGGPAR